MSTRLRDAVRLVHCESKESIDDRQQSPAGSGAQLRRHEGRDQLGCSTELAIPSAPDFYLLEEARQRVITYLDWVTHDLTRGPSADQLRREIEHATERLMEVSLALRAFFDRGCALDG
jgi:hypothetical protein